jgi:hypothetical protein
VQQLLLDRHRVVLAALPGAESDLSGLALEVDLRPLKRSDHPLSLGSAREQFDEQVVPGCRGDGEDARHLFGRPSGWVGIVGLGALDAVHRVGIAASSGGGPREEPDRIAMIFRRLAGDILRSWMQRLTR